MQGSCCTTRRAASWARPSQTRPALYSRHVCWAGGSGARPAAAAALQACWSAAGPDSLLCPDHAMPHALPCLCPAALPCLCPAANPALLEPEVDQFYAAEPPRDESLLVQVWRGRRSLVRQLASPARCCLMSRPSPFPLIFPQCLKPGNFETPHALLAGDFTTPADLHFVRNHLPVPAGLSAESHRRAFRAGGGSCCWSPTVNLAPHPCLLPIARALHCALPADRLRRHHPPASAASRLRGRAWRPPHCPWLTCSTATPKSPCTRPCRHVGGAGRAAIGGGGAEKGPAGGLGGATCREASGCVVPQHQVCERRAGFCVCSSPLRPTPACVVRSAAVRRQPAGRDGGTPLGGGACPVELGRHGQRAVGRRTAARRPRVSLAAGAEPGRPAGQCSASRGLLGRRPPRRCAGRRGGGRAPLTDEARAAVLRSQRLACLARHALQCECGCTSLPLCKRTT